MNLISEKKRVERRRLVLRQRTNWKADVWVSSCDRFIKTVVFHGQKEKSGLLHVDSLLLYVSILEGSGTIATVHHPAAPVFVFPALVFVEAQSVLVSHVVVEKMEGLVLAL